MDILEIDWSQNSGHFGHWTWTFDIGHLWTLDVGHWKEQWTLGTLDSEHWTLDIGNVGHWTSDSEHRTLDFRHWTLNSVHGALDSGQ